MLRAPVPTGADFSFVAFGDMGVKKKKCAMASKVMQRIQGVCVCLVRSVLALIAWKQTVTVWGCLLVGRGTAPGAIDMFVCGQHLLCASHSYCRYRLVGSCHRGGEAYFGHCGLRTACSFAHVGRWTFESGRLREKGCGGWQSSESIGLHLSLCQHVTVAHKMPNVVMWQPVLTCRAR